MSDQAKIINLLKELDIAYRWIEHKPVFTVAESLKQLADKRPIKCLLLQEKNNGQKVFVVVAGEKRLNTKLIAKELDTKKLQFANAEVLLGTMGVTPGAVSIFGLMHSDPNNIKIVLDNELLSEPELGFHPNDNTASVFIPGETVTKVIEALEHSYQIMDLP
jgi:Ala-tRNA(Pro) deacylase